MKKFLTLTSLVILLFAAAASAQEEAEAPDAKKLYDGLSERIKDLKSYKLIFEYTEAIPDKDKDEWRKCEFWFMGRDFMRLEVLDGEDKGSKVAFNAKRSKSKAYAKASYMPIAIGVSKDDERLEGFFESDWFSDIESISEMLKGAEYALLGEEKLRDRESYKIEIKTKEAKYDRILLWIDKKDSVLLQYEYFIKGEFHARKEWYQIELDAKMNPKSFKP